MLFRSRPSWRRSGGGGDHRVSGALADVGNMSTEIQSCLETLDLSKNPCSRSGLERVCILDYFSALNPNSANGIYTLFLIFFIPVYTPSRLSAW